MPELAALAIEERDHVRAELGLALAID